MSTAPPSGVGGLTGGTPAQTQETLRGIIGQFPSISLSHILSRISSRLTFHISCLCTARIQQLKSQGHTVESNQDLNKLTKIVLGFQLQQQRQRQQQQLLLQQQGKLLPLHPFRERED